MILSKADFSKPFFAGFVSFILFFSWILLIVISAGRYQNMAWADPLAMINVLFPFFWVILACLLVVCFVCFVRFGENKWLHVLLICELSWILYFTPFLLSGFSWSPDSLWHGGIGSYMPEILSGANYPLMQYGQSYPFSFLITYLVEQISGLNVFAYTLYVFPAIGSVTIPIVAYVFGSRVFNPKIAFLSMLLSIPALHYVEPHVSPYCSGTILVFISLILLTKESQLCKIMSLLIIVTLTFTHPISPIILGVYLLAALFASFLFRKSIYSSSGFASEVSSLSSVLAFVGLVWFSWTIFQAIPNYPGVEIAVEKVFNFNFLSGFFAASEFTVGGGSFVYSQITNISLGIYAVFLVSVLVIFGSDFLRVLRSKRKMELSKKLYRRLSLSLAAIGFAAIGFMLFASSGERYLLGRGLLFFLLIGAFCIVAFLFGSKKWVRIKTGVVIVFVVFLVFSYPVIAYSKEAYNTFTPSAGEGLSFLSDKVNLSNNTLSMIMDQQIASYADLEKGLHMVGFPPNVNSTSPPDVVVMRVNAYFLVSMRSDNSFVENSYTILSDYLSEGPFYDRVYSSSKFEVYVRNP